MKHRTRAVAPDVRASRRAARRLAARFFVALAAVAASAAPVHAMGGDRLPMPDDPPVPWAATAAPSSHAGGAARDARPGDDLPGERRGGVATAGTGRSAVAATAASTPVVETASQGRSLPETRTWALFGVGLLAVLMMARRQRQHD